MVKKLSVKVKKLKQTTMKRLHAKLAIFDML